LSNIRKSIRFSKLPHKEKFASDIKDESYSTQIYVALSKFCSLLDKPFIIFFDEIDGLQDGTLITFLRQLRDGYITRKNIPFVHSIALVGMRNIRDYKNKIREGHQTLGSTSPFNIITKALTIKNFSLTDVENLYAQHTQETGQVFEKQAVEKVFDQTDGQPWLVNAIAREIIVEILENDFTITISAEMVEQAIQNIILRRDTHIDSLLDKLKEERVRKIIEPIITGKLNELNITDDDTQYCLDLGLIKDEKRTLKPANKIYAEVIIRTLSYNTQYHLHTQIQNIWIDESDKIDMNGLLQAFQQFWRENSKIWTKQYQYQEAAPHLVLQAFLQRIINGGGSIIREYAAGRERIDICVIYKNFKYPVEMKIWYSQKTKPQGITQLANYMDTLGENTGWLVIFDRRTSKSWKDKIYWKTEEVDNKTIYIVGC